MSGYERPGFTEMLPGLNFSHDAGMTAPGTPSPGALPDTDSAGTGPEAGTTVTSALVVPNFGSVVNGVRAPVAPTDVLVTSQVVSYGGQPDPLTGLGAEAGDTSAGSGPDGT